MNSKKFSEAMSELDNKYVDEAINYKKKAKKLNRIKWGAMAACLCFVAAAGATIFLHQNVSIPGADDEGGTGAYSVAVYPATESEENVASADVTSLTESEALSNSLAKHLPRELSEGFHYGRGSIYHTVMKDGTKYHMLRIEYINGEIPEQQFTEDGGAIAPNPDTTGETFIVCVMDYKPKTDRTIYSSSEEITLSLLEQNRDVYLHAGDCYVSVFTDTAKPTAAFEALKTIE